MLSASFFMCLILACGLGSSGPSHPQSVGVANTNALGQTYTPSDKKFKHPPVCKSGELHHAVAMAVYPYRHQYIFTQTEKIDFDVRTAAEICPVADAFLLSNNHIDGKNLGTLPTHLVYFLSEDKHSFTTAIVVLDGNYILFENDWSKLRPLSELGKSILRRRAHPLPVTN